jgi:predicted metal-dependent peptidase
MLLGSVQKLVKAVSEKSVNEIAVLIDDSGSMRESDFADITELLEGLRSITSFKASVFCLRLGVLSTYNGPEFLKEQSRSRGGTDLTRTVSELSEQYSECQLRIIITDGEVLWPSEQLMKAVPTIVVLTARGYDKGLPTYSPDYYSIKEVEKNVPNCPLR